MNLLADENVDEPIVEWLLTLGINFRSIRRTMPGISDFEVIAVAEAEDRIILTNDLDFGELVFHRNLSTAGIILLRVKPPLPEVRLTVLRRHWDEIILKARGNFMVVTRYKLRVRPIS
jgi:predicted nuclease of predicted toxin-antitoxin system